MYRKCHLHRGRVSMLMGLGTLLVVGSALPVRAAEGEKKTPAISGKVTFDGKAKAPGKIDTAGDPACHKMHQEKPLLKEDLPVVGEKGELKNVFVYVKNPPKQDYKAPEEPVVLTQEGCQYVPHIIGIMVGQPLEIRNSDPTNHNIHAMPKKNEEFNFSQPRKNMKETKKFDKPEMAVPIKCDVHAWMHALAFVMEHPFYAVTDEKGEFAIHGLPAGEYEVVFWHEETKTLPEQTVKVKVEDGKTTKMDEVQFKPKAATRRR